MSQFGSMEPLLQLPTMKKKEKKLPSSCRLFGLAQVLSLYAAVLFGCIYIGSAYYTLEHGPPSCLCPCGGVQVPVWFVRRYVLTGADAVDAAVALFHGLLTCGAFAASSAAVELPPGGRSRRGLGDRAAACVTLAVMAACHWMYLRMLGLFRVNSTGDLYLAVETACVVAAAALNLLGFMAFVLGDGGDDGEQAGRAPAQAG